jgi:hypothetical protein
LWNWARVTARKQVLRQELLGFKKLIMEAHGTRTKIIIAG